MPVVIQADVSIALPRYASSEFFVIPIGHVQLQHITELQNTEQNYISIAVILTRLKLWSRHRRSKISAGYMVKILDSTSIFFCCVTKAYKLFVTSIGNLTVTFSVSNRIHFLCDIG